MRAISRRVVTRGAAAALGTLALRAPAAAGRDARVASAAAEPWRIAWRVPVADPWQSPVVVAGDRSLVLLVGRNLLVAVEAASGATAWRHELQASAAIGCACLGAPALAPEAGRVYAVSDGNELRSLDVPTGRIGWGRRAGDLVITAPVVGPSGVLVATADGSDLALIAFDAATGERRWRASESRRLLPDPVWDAETGAVYVLDAAGGLRALDAATGELRWQVLGGTGAGDAPMAGLSAASLVDGGLAVVRDRGLELVERMTGAVRWRYTPPDGWLAWAVAADVGHVAEPAAEGATPGATGTAGLLAGGLGEAIVALDARSGEPRWQVAAVGGSLTEPAIGRGVGVLVTGDDLIAARLPDGAELWRRPAASLTGRPVPALAEGWLAAGAGDQVRVWEIASGAPVADVRLAAGVVGPPAVASTRLYVQTLATRNAEGMAYALVPACCA